MERAAGELEYTVKGQKKVAPLMLLDGTRVTEPPAEGSKEVPPPKDALPALKCEVAKNRSLWPSLSKSKRPRLQPVSSRVAPTRLADTVWSVKNTCELIK